MTDVPTTPRKPMSDMRRLRIWEAQKGICVICDLKIDGAREKWTIEHIVPLGLGGEDSDWNCAPAHEHCRRQKDKTDVKAIAKAKRMKAKHLGIKKRSSFRKPPSNSHWDWNLGRRVMDE